jgi:DNA invertase Pin-like site-specific DNA recombinase
MGANGNGLRRAALYARVSTSGQSPENQLVALRAFAAARGWEATEFIDHGVSGAKERRPALDALLAAAKARKLDVVVCVKLDRLARSVRHLVAMAGEFQALGVDLVALDQAIDTTTPAGRLLFHVLSAIAEFERDLIRDRVLAGLQRARTKGTRSGRAIGRPRLHHVSAAAVQALLTGEGLSLRAAARRLGVPVQAAHRAVRNPVPQPLAKAAIV